MMQLIQLQHSTRQHHSTVLCAVPCYQDPMLHYAGNMATWHRAFAFLLLVLACIAVGRTRTCKQVLVKK